ncbi:MAG: hypothetical protein EBT07_09245 [Actinobacteria bacterium]|nr:hypothetical protein [Actinomycetota bacterium]NBT76427.1 hypothetical protein [Betaproteobacteria bacterium]
MNALEQQILLAIHSGNFQEAYRLLGLAPKSFLEQGESRALLVELFVQTENWSDLETLIFHLKRNRETQIEAATVSLRSMYEQGNFAAAINVYEEQLKHHEPTLATRLNYAFSLMGMKRIKEAFAVLSNIEIGMAIESESNVYRFIKAVVNLAVVLRNQGYLVAARRYARLLLRDHLRESEWNLLNYLLATPWSGPRFKRNELTLEQPSQSMERIRLGVFREFLKISSIFYPTYPQDNNRENLEEYNKIYRSLTVESNELDAEKKLQSRRLPSPAKIGLYLSEPNRHVSKWLLALFEKMGLKKTEIFIISTNDINGVTFSHRKILLPRADEKILEQAHLIRTLGLDVLIYSDIGMDSRTRIFSQMRLAPIQVCHWGHPVTSGSRAIDYYVSSAAMEPEYPQDGYSEKLISLPSIGIYIKGEWYSHHLLQNKVQRSHGLIVMNALNKMSIEYIESLREIVKHSNKDFRISILKTGQSDIDRFYIGRLKKVVNQSVLSVRDRLSGKAYLDFVGDHSVNADMFFWSGGNTTLDCIFLGVPTLTLPGKTMRSRHTCAINTVCGLEVLNAQDQRDYESKAISLLNNDKDVRDVRAQMQETRLKLIEREDVLEAYQAFVLGLI